MNRIQLYFLITLLSFSAKCQDINNLKIFETWLESKMTYEKWPGVLIGIVKDKELVWIGNYGFSNIIDSIPLNPNMHFSIASNTKMLTAIGIMKLKNQGLLNLDDPAYKYVPELKNIKSIKGSDPSVITIRHILTHTSGLPVEPWYFNWEERPTLDEIISNLDKQTLGIPTSVDFKYSNLGFAILGRVLENISRKEYTDFMKEEVLDPIGMTKSHFILNDSNQYAQGYQPLKGDRERKPVKLLEYNGWAAAGGLYSNLKDLAKFISWFNTTYSDSENSFLDAITLREMTRVSWVPKSWNYGIGLGFFVYKSSEKMIGYGGHNPGFKTDITIFPDSNLGVITLTNAEDISVYPDVNGSLSAQVIKYLLPGFKDAKESDYEPYYIDKEVYEGVYSGYWADYKVVDVNGVLTIFRITNERPDQFQLKIKPEEQHTFKVISEDMGRWRGEMIYFKNMNEGKMQQLLMDGTTFYRKK